MNMPSNEEATTYVDCDKRDTFGSFFDVGRLYERRGALTHPYSFSFARIFGGENTMLTIGQKMVDYRNDHNLTIGDMSRKLRISGQLLDILERGGVTHPNIVKRIQDVYEFTEDEVEMLLPKCRRPGDPEYDPEHYVVVPDEFVTKLLPKKEEIFDYVAEHNYQLSRRGKI